jgi:hypothetical protein
MMINCAGGFRKIDDADHPLKEVGAARGRPLRPCGPAPTAACLSPTRRRMPFLQVMLNFTVDCLVGGRSGTVLLITGDADFVRPAVWCKQQGCVQLEVLYFDPTASR